IENYCIVASSALLFADSLTTLTDEVQRIWHREFSGATVVFLLTRYVAVAERIVLVASVFLPTVQDKDVGCSCVPILRLDDVLTDITYLMFGVFMTLRARGIWGRGWIPIAILALLAPVRSAITIYAQTHYTPIAFGAPLYGCGAAFNLTISHIPNIARVVGIASRAAALSIDTFVLVLTWIRTLGIKRESSRLGMHTPLVTLLLRDGEWYYLFRPALAMYALTSTDVLTYTADHYSRLTVIFSCRFMLSLRGVYLSNHSTESESAENSDEYGHGTYFTSMRFSSSIVGNMGAPLDTFGVAMKDYSYTITETIGDDEPPELSRDPIVAGLHHPAGIELPETPTAAHQYARESA
ncbi:hypothetical protein C2E23DRAFT_731207, partial [Lenzites betulinus]